MHTLVTIICVCKKSVSSTFSLLLAVSHDDNSSQHTDCHLISQSHTIHHTSWPHLAERKCSLINLPLWAWAWRWIFPFLKPLNAWQKARISWSIASNPPWAQNNALSTAKRLCLAVARAHLWAPWRRYQCFLHFHTPHLSPDWLQFAFPIVNFPICLRICSDWTP